MNIDQIFIDGGSKNDLTARLMDALRDYSQETLKHSIVTSGFTVILARQAGMSETEIELAASCALLHDVGKLEIPLEIITKPAVLTEDEMDIMKEHSKRGSDILSRSDKFGVESLVACSHHEWHDGSGYPAGISGDQIPYLASLVAVADVLEALTSKREYRDPLLPSIAIDRIRNASGVQFNPESVEVMCSCREELEKVKKL